MNKIIKTIKKNISKFRNSGYFRAKFVFTKKYENPSIRDDMVLIQSYDGSSISGNPYYILKELCENNSYSNLKKIVVARAGSIKKIRKKIQERQWNNTSIVIIHSKEYCEILASAKYLINNSTFPTYFIKNKKQVYLNTWHGIPLKTLGRSIKSAPNELGNTQRNFLMADYLLYPNEYMFNIMKKDYMLDNMYTGKYMLTGYPRNTAFYNSELRKEIIERYELIGKKIVVFMPTWRGSLETKNTEEQMIYTKHAIYEMEDKLDEDTVVFVKLHNYVKKTMNFKKFKKIKNMPDDYETYEFLNIADCLITDYSSVFFDFANTNKKIILYAYDLDKYIRDRGIYLDFNTLPFTLTYNSEQLINEVKKLEDYKPYKEEIYPIIKYDGKDSSKKICKYIFEQKEDPTIKIINGIDYNNKKQNVLLFPGALNKNGITTAFRGLVNTINENSDKNYIITFYKNAVNKNKEYIKEFINNDYIVIQGQKDITLSEAIYQFLYFKCNINIKMFEKKLDKIFEREVKRVYPNMKFEYVVNFSGYESNMMQLASRIGVKNAIWAHNNMYKEEKLKKNFHINSLKYAYSHSDKIVVVRESMKEELEKYIRPKDKDKLTVVHNINDVHLIKENAQQPIEFEGDTYCNIEIEELKQILDDDTITKFINIARFSKEKGLDRLIEAFDEYRKKVDQNAYLIIIGGYGKEFNNIKLMLKNDDGTDKIDNVIIIKSILNPYPILNKSQVFVLSSIYEGLPMTIMEALILGKIVISTNITGPKEFLEQGYGYLVENSKDGILKGLIDYKEGNIKNLKNFDYIEFNNKAKKEFDEIFK